MENLNAFIGFGVLFFIYEDICYIICDIRPKALWLYTSEQIMAGKPKTQISILGDITRIFKWSQGSLISADRLNIRHSELLFFPERLVLQEVL